MISGTLIGIHKAKAKIVRRVVFLFLINAHTLFAREVIDLLIKIPTRSRPEQFFVMLDMYYKKLSGKYSYLFLISCDVHDDSMNNEKVITRFKKYKNLICRFSRNRSKIEAYNKDIDEFVDKFKVLLVASDDMEPQQKGYDEIIMKKMLHYFPKLDGVLNFNDGHHLQQKINTYPVMGNTFYQQFGYVYFPSYKSFYCDEELKHVALLLKKEKICNELLLYHHNPDWTKVGIKDQLYIANDLDWEEDKKLFLARKKQLFYLQKPIAIR